MKSGCKNEVIDMKNILKTSLALMLGMSICYNSNGMFDAHGSTSANLSQNASEINVDVKGTVDAILQCNFLGKHLDFVLIKDGKCRECEKDLEFTVNHKVKLKVESNTVDRANKFVLKHSSTADQFHYKVDLKVTEDSTTNLVGTPETDISTEKEIFIDDVSKIRKLVISAKIDEADQNKVFTAATGEYKGDLKITISAN